MVKDYLRLTFILLLILCSNVALANRSYIHVVGSSTVFPFISTIAEEFSRTYRVKTPIVESTGTGAGFKLFCSSNHGRSPDIAVASRKMNGTELMLCEANNILSDDILEFKLGNDAIVIANSIESKTYDFTIKDIFYALSFYVPKNNISVMKNKYMHWSQINGDLPESKIEIYGPLRSTGTFDATASIVFKGNCLSSRPFVMTFSSEDLQKICSMVRTDKVFTEVGGDENLIVQKIARNASSFGILGYSFLIRNAQHIKANPINYSMPTQNSITDGSYPLSRPLYIYVRKSHINNSHPMRQFLKEIFSNNAIGDYGYLRDIGLTPPDDKEIQEIRSKIDKL